MTIEILETVFAKRGDQVERWDPGDLIILPLEQAKLVLERVGHKVRAGREYMVKPVRASKPIQGAEEQQRREGVQ